MANDIDRWNFLLKYPTVHDIFFNYIHVMERSSSRIL